MPAVFKAFRGPRQQGSWAAAWAAVVLVLSWIHAAPPASAAEPIPRPLSFIDYFNSGRLDGWTVHDEGTVSAPSKWQVVNYQLKQSSNIYGGSTARSDIRKPGTNIVAGNPAWKNYDVSVRMRTFDDDGVGVVFRYADKNNHYRFSMDRQRGYQRLVKKVNGVYTLLAQNSRGYATNTSYLLRVVAVGSSLQILVDGVVVFTVNDSSLPAGKFGMYTWGSNNTIFDSLSARVQNDTYFTVAVVPDTQYAAESYPAIFASQMRFLAARRADLNLALVMHSGDVVDEAAVPGQWKNAKTYLSYLSGKVPFVVAAGNHDVFDPTDTPENRYKVHRTPFNTLISGLANYSVSGTYLPGDYLNTYYLFNAGGVEILVAQPRVRGERLDPGLGVDDRRQVSESPCDGRDARLPEREEPAPRCRPVGPVPAQVLQLDHEQRDRHVARVRQQAPEHPVRVQQPRDRAHERHRLVLRGPPREQQRRGPIGASGPGQLPDVPSRGPRIPSPGQVLPGEGRVEVRTYSPYENASLTDPLNQFSLSGVDLSGWPAPQQ